MRSQALVTEPLSNEVLASLDWTVGGMLWTLGTEYASVRKIENRLFVCRGLSVDPTPQEIEENKEWQIRKLLSFFPTLTSEDISISHQWSGLMVETPLSRPFVDVRNGWYEAFGHSGNGLTNGIMCGKLLAEHFNGEPLPALYFSVQNFS